MNMLNETRLNVQRFAEGSVQTTTLNASGNDLSPEMKTFYDRTLIDEAEPNLVHDQFGQERDIPAGGGKSIEFRRFSSLPKATTPITEGVTPAGNKLNITSLTATVEQYGDYITQSDLLEMTAIDNTIVEATSLLGSQAGRTLDTVTREVLHAGTNVMYAPKVAADGAETAVTSRKDLTADCRLRVKDVFRVAAFLKSMNAPKVDGSYVCVLHPYVAYDLMMEAGDMWVDIHKYSDPSAIFAGEIGSLGGVRFVETTEAKIYKDSTCPTGLAVFGCLFLGANAYGKTKLANGGLETIVKQKGSAGTGDPLNQRSSVGWKATKAAKILVEEYMVRFECCSSQSAVVEAN